jgi:hypothetical protein
MAASKLVYPEYYREKRMNKRMASEKSTQSRLSIGELRQMIAAARDRGGLSRVNAQIYLAQACDIYEGALAGRPDDEVPAGMKYDVYKRHDVPSMDSLIIRNILRDCA